MFAFRIVMFECITIGSYDRIHVRYNKIIYHTCEGRIEKFASRIVLWHNEACGVMTHGDPEGRIFLSYPHTNNGFFSCSPLFLFIYLCIYLFIIHVADYVKTCLCY